MKWGEGTDKDNRSDFFIPLFSMTTKVLVSTGYKCLDKSMVINTGLRLKKGRVNGGVLLVILFF